MRILVPLCVYTACVGYGSRLQNGRRSALSQMGASRQQRSSLQADSISQAPSVSQTLARVLFAIAPRSISRRVRTAPDFIGGRLLRHRAHNRVQLSENQSMHQSSAPSKSTPTFVRLQESATTMELQTLAKTLSFMDDARNVSFEVSLVSTVHLADKSYYASVQSEADDRANAIPQHDRILFELLVDEDIVEVDASGLKRIRANLQPGVALADQAAKLKLATQVDELDYQADNRWVLADVTRAALHLKEQEIGVRPPWTQFLESLRSLFSAGPRRRASPISFFRTSIAWLSPAPEFVLLLDDWIYSRVGAGFGTSLSPLANAIVRFDWQTAMALSFAQTIVTGQTVQKASLDNLARVQWRNDHAIAEVARALDDGCTRVALVYGALHMPDLEAKLRSRYRMVGSNDLKWITAWSIPLATKTVTADATRTMEIFRRLFAPSLVFVGLLSIDGFDYLAAITEFARGIESQYFSEAFFFAMFYIVRHALIYFALERWVFQWDSRLWSVESDR